MDGWQLGFLLGNPVYSYKHYQFRSGWNLPEMYGKKDAEMDWFCVIVWLWTGLHSQS